MQVKPDEELFFREEFEDPVFGCAFIFRHRDVDFVGNVDLLDYASIIRHDTIFAHKSEQRREKLELLLDLFRENGKVIFELLLL